MSLSDIERLTHLEAIKALKARYFRCVDTKQWDELETLFLEDATLRWGAAPEEVSVGRSRIVATMRATLSGATTVHQGHTPEIEFLSATSARGIWAMYDYVAPVDPSKSGFGPFEGWGHYHDEYARGEDGRWRFASVELTRLRIRPLDG